MSNLSQESTRKLACAIAPAVFEYISEDGRYLDGVMNTIESAITSVIGHTSPELVGELGCEIMGMIGVQGSNDPYADNNIWKTRYETLYRYVRTTYADSYVEGAEYGIIDRAFPEDN